MDNVQTYYLNWCQEAFEKGMRAVRVDGKQMFRYKDKTYMASYPGDPVKWLHLVTYQSDTWKERHAKGTPVKMTFGEWSTCVDNTDMIQNIDRYFNNGNPIANCVSFKQGSDKVAAFCNFRYKPDWLSRPDKHCAKGNCIGDGSCYHCGCAYTRNTKKPTI
jgi:hypothetical protein